MAITRDLWIVLRARDEASRIIRSFGQNVSGAANSAAANMSKFESTMQSLGLRLQQFAMTSMLAGTAVAGMGAAGIAFLKSASDVAVAYEKQVRATKTQVDDITVSLNDLAQVGRRVARQVEIPFEQMQDTLFFIFSSMNVTLAESEQLLKGFAKEAVAGQTSIENAARSNIAIMNSLGLSTKDLQRIQDVQFQVVRKGVITYEELSEVIGRALPAAARSGQSIETLGAMMAFLTRNGLSAAMASASAARALESFAHPTTVKRLEQIGIKVRDAKGEFLPLIQVMGQMNEKLKDMAQPERAAFFQELFKGAGGTIQARRFWDTAFKNFDDFTQMMGFMTNSAGVFENAYGNMANSVANQTVLLENKWMLVKEALGRAVMPHLIKLITLLGQVLDWFDRLPEPTKNMIAQFILWGSVIGVAVGALMIFIGVIAFFVSGVMLAGEALIVILAALAGVTAAVIALGGAFYVAWQRSTEFRAIITDIGSILKDLWQGVVNIAGDIQKAFDDKVKPALENLWNVTETKVMPAIREFIRMWKEEVFPKLQEAGAIIKDMVIKTFETVADTINNYIIPAINAMSAWWERNGDSLRPLLRYMGELVKWLLIVGAALIIAPIIGFVGAIIIMINTVFTVIEVLKTLWNWLVTAFNAVGSFFSGLVQGIINFVMGIYNTVANALKPLTDLIKAIFGLIFEIIRFFAVLVREIIKDWIIPFVKDFIDGFMKLYNMISKIVMDIVNAVIDFFSKIFGEAEKQGKPFFDVVKKVWDDVSKFIKGAIDGIVEFFKDAGKWLFDAGKNIITGLLNGITEKVNDLKKKLKEITDMIPEIKGPKSVDLKLLVPVGKNIMQGFMNGIDSQIPMIKAQLQGLTSQIGGLTVPTFTIPTPAFAGGQVQEKNITQNITIHTQEINPRIQAEELGFELGDRL